MAKSKRRPRRNDKPADKKWSPRGDREERNYEDRRDPRNDISWYSRNPNLLVAAGSFPFPYRPGMNIPMGDPIPVSSAETSNTIKRSIQVPGIMVLDWMPSVGKSQVATDPASIAAKEIYAKVRSKFSGSLEADGPDFVIYLMALDSIFSYIAWLKRLYRVMNAWTPENYIVPEAVITAMGIGRDTLKTLREQRVLLWQNINELVLQSRKFTCPAVMDIFNRHYWMSDNVYTDSPEINSQFYMFNLKAVFKFSMLNMPDGNAGPGLAMTALPWMVNSSTTNKFDAASFYQFGRDLIDALVAWDDAYTINGYLQRAYEGEPNFIVDELPSDQPFNPVYVPEVLAQIENSRAIPLGAYIKDLSSFNITQQVQTNAVLSNPQYTVSNLSTVDRGHEIEAQGYAIPPVLSVRSMTPTVADSVIASRLQAAVTLVSKGDNSATLAVVAGTEIPIAWRLLNSDSQFTIGMDVLGLVTQTATYFSTDGYTPIAPVLRMEQFDWHPFAFYTDVTFVSDTDLRVTASNFSVVGDTHNITTISIDDLRNLHKICVYSELNAFSA